MNFHNEYLGIYRRGFSYWLLNDKPYKGFDNDVWINQEALEHVLSPDEFRELKLKLRKLSVEVNGKI